MKHRRAFRTGTARCLIVLAAAMILSACSGLQIINNISPSSHYIKTVDIRYAENDRNLLDYYEPVEASEDAPLVVFFYGGGWKAGSREQYEFVASALTGAGFRVVIPDYRLFPEVLFPTFIEDAAAVVAWAADHKLDRTKQGNGLYLVGHSAGAHIAALLAADPRYLSEESVPIDLVAGLVGLSGPYDFLPIENGYLLDVFPQEQREPSQPIHFVNADMPPTLLIHGADDEVVEPGNTTRFAEALRDVGVPVTVKYYEGTGHARVAAALSPRLHFLGNTFDDIIAFIRSIEQRRAAED